MINCASVRTLASKDLQWSIDLYGTDYRASVEMPCELERGHADRHLHRVICQYLSEDEVITWWASWEHRTGETYALFSAPECGHYSDEDGYCRRLVGHTGGHGE